MEVAPDCAIAGRFSGHAIDDDCGTRSVEPAHRCLGVRRVKERQTLIEKPEAGGFARVKKHAIGKRFAQMQRNDVTEHSAGTEYHYARS